MYTHIANSHVLNLCFMYALAVVVNRSIKHQTRATHSQQKFTLYETYPSCKKISIAEVLRKQYRKTHIRGPYLIARALINDGHLHPH